MSDDKKALDWAAEILAESNTPQGEFQWSQGSNYGQTGYSFDQPAGAPAMERPQQPGATPGPPPGTNSVRGMQNLPEDVLAASEAPLDEAAMMNDFEGGLHLGGMFTEDEGHFKDSSAMDLQWLDPTQEQDPDRLPKNPSALGLEELENAWGFGRRTDGIERVPTKDLDAERYHQRMNESPQPATPGPKLAAEDVNVVRRAVQKAVRDAHFGKPVAEIRRDLVATLGDNASHTRGVVAHLSRDIGLAGNVFVRASAFPGIRNGKWVKDIKKKAHSARYVITDDPAVGVKLGMVPVTEVPWKKALHHYGPRLKAAGYNVDTSVSAREALRKAFIGGRRAAETPLQMPKPIEVMPADTITTKQALAQFRMVSEAQQPVFQINDGSKQRRAKALGTLVKWVKSGDLSSEQMFALRKLNTEDMLIQASEMVSAPKEGSYEGAGIQHTQDAQLERNASKGTTKTAEFERMADWTRRAMNEGWMGQDLDQLIEARWSPHILTKAARELRELRATHEGLAGNIYVDAAAYASPTGVKGCKEASSKHRTNQVRRVLAMSRCGSCVHKKAMPDGSGHCSVYNKPLIKAAELEGINSLKVIQGDAIKMANASDAEVTGSLFTDRHTSIVSEFGLQSHMDVSFNNVPDIEKLAELHFDGVYLGEED